MSPSTPKMAFGQLGPRADMQQMPMHHELLCCHRSPKLASTRRPRTQRAVVLRGCLLPKTQKERQLKALKKRHGNLVTRMQN